MVNSAGCLVTHGSCRVSRGPLPAPGSSQNRTCEFPRIRLKHSKGPVPDPAVSCQLESTTTGSLLSDCLRNTRLQPPYLRLDRPPIDGRPREVRGCAGCSHSRLSPSLVKTVLQALSRRSTCWTWAPLRAGHVRPVSGSLQTGVRFFQHPVPHLLGRPLRSACLEPAAAVPERLWPPKRGEKIGPCSGRNDPGRQRLGSSPSGRKDRAMPRVRRRYEVSTFRSRSPRGGRCLLSTGCHVDREGLPFSAPSGHLRRLAQASQPLWLALA